MALQPSTAELLAIAIYNSRNYYGIIACSRYSYKGIRSTIVEIIMALQPKTFLSVHMINLQQQKLLWHYSRAHARAQRLGSTIVEIIMALQPSLTHGLMLSVSTIVEIIMALQPSPGALVSHFHLQQQKLLWHYSPYFMQSYVKQSKLKRCMSIFFRFLTHLTIEYSFDF